jgi:hypothetical protein
VRHDLWMLNIGDLSLQGYELVPVTTAR